MERTRMWEENRQKKIKEKQQQKGQSEVSECTFRPTVVSHNMRVRTNIQAPINIQERNLKQYRVSSQEAMKH